MEQFLHPPSGSASLASLMTSGITVTSPLCAVFLCNWVRIATLLSVSALTGHSWQVCSDLTSFLPERFFVLLRALPVLLECVLLVLWGFPVAPFRVSQLEKSEIN